MYKYFPHTPEDIQAMLDKIGVKDLEGLFAEIPEGIRFRGEYDLPTAQSELEVREAFERLCAMNQPLTVFAGAGVYDHYTPSVVHQLHPLSGRDFPGYSTLYL